MLRWDLKMRDGVLKVEGWLDSCDAHMLRAAGIYAILDEDDEVMYVGESSCFIHRWGQHCSNATGPNTPPVPSKETYKFIILEYEDTRENRVIRERFWNNLLKPKYYRRQRGSSSDPKVDPLRIRKLRQLQRRLHIQPNDELLYLDEQKQAQEELRAAYRRYLDENE